MNFGSATCHSVCCVCVKFLNSLKNVSIFAGQLSNIKIYIVTW